MMMRFGLIAALATASSGVSAAVVPFTESFTNGASNWSAPATWDAGGFIVQETNVNAASFGVVIGPRGQASADASGGAFVGNWIAQGVTALTFSVRHNAPVPMNFGARLALASNFPAAIGLDFAPVLPGVWTTVTIPIVASYPGWVSFEGSDFQTTLSGVANVQLLYSVPQSLAGAGTIVRFEADDVSIVPTPGALGVCTVAAAGLLRRRRPA